MSDIKLPDASNVEITVGRWGVYITIHTTDSKTHNYVASADGAFTDQSGIWFGTLEEYREAEREVS